MRHIERINQKKRDPLIKERTERIRSLTAFVKKRDPRAKAYKKLMEERNISERERMRKIALEQQERHQKERREMMNAAPIDKDSIQALEAELAQLEKEFSADESENEEDEDDGLYCIACEKGFRSAGQKKSHDKSKLHRKNIALLKEHLVAEEVELEGLAAEIGLMKLAETDSVPAESSGKKSKKQKKRAKQLKKEQEEEEIDEAPEDSQPDSGDPPNTDEIGIDEFLQDTKKAKKKKKTKGVALSDLACKICRQEFVSKNKLFAHIKETGHAALKS